MWAIAADVERYPEWANDVKDVVVTPRDDEGRPAEVEFRASALGRSTHYTLAYDYSEAPDVLAWRMVQRRHHAHHRRRLPLLADADGGTEVRYDLAIELVVPLPGFVKRRAEVRILNTVESSKPAPRRDTARATGSGLHVGIDVGGTKCLGVALDADGNVVGEDRRPTPHGPGASTA